MARLDSRCPLSGDRQNEHAADSMEQENILNMLVHARWPALSTRT